MDRKRKRILIISRAFYPVTSPRAYRTTELAKEFSRKGHEVVVIAPRNEIVHPQFEKDFNIQIKHLGEYQWKGVQVKGGYVENLFRRFLSRYLNKFFEYPNVELVKMVRNSLENEIGYDLLISIAIPHPIHWGVASVWGTKQRIAKCWIADCGDPYMGRESNSFKPAFYFRLIEKWFCKKANYITVPTKDAIKAYFPEFHSKIRVIPQGFNFEEYQFPEPVKNKKPLFIYAGSFIPTLRDPTELLTFLNQLEVDFEFRIYTWLPYIVPEFVKKSKGRIILCDPIPRLELMQQLSAADFVVNFENTGKTQTPSKLIDYAIVKRPILSIKTGALNKDVVVEFLNANYSNAKQIDNVEQYHIQHICDQFLNLINP